ncbi:MAG: hypothetical protein ACRDWS_03905 [Acidimicrobiia bacterium]
MRDRFHPMAVGSISPSILDTIGDTPAIRVRIGIHTGTARSQDGDYFGPTLNRVSRLMAAEARAAFHAKRWEQTHDLLMRIEKAQPLTSAQQDMAANALWWLGQARRHGRPFRIRVQRLPLRGKPSKCGDDCGPAMR